ncbi:hypothetical protein CDAR_516871 [Caerostris darwini]|uniref:Gustatory receptor n=1 Tax=Caerostris darwini TaxID=1538125 RepID=A0AAV4UDZ6_9ARAC|nr:hypothetical protein CDAR_516871 [Caerostris darwini]
MPHTSSDEIFISITFYRTRTIASIASTEAIEDAISMCSFFLYGAIITQMLNSFNMITVQETLYHNRLKYIFVVIVISMAFAVFVTLTVSASSVIVEDESLKHLVVHFTEKPFLFNRAFYPLVCHVKMLHYFNLLSKVIRGYKLHLTGGRMFVIERSVLFTITGLVLSYGVLLFQFGNQI